MHQHEKLQRLRTLARLLDDQFRIPGTNRRVGLDGLIGLVTGAGDLVTIPISLYIVWQARQLDLPGAKLVSMLGNIGLDALVGTVPVLGDLFDFTFKANLRNIAIIERHLAEMADIPTSHPAERSANG
ncbi:MAG: DUF4112 domain-containing protein [Calditrichaeota bacterium]|nr:DUF4112 domain-containing protein [Calditrichota bacterium]